MPYCRGALFAVALLIPTGFPAWGQAGPLSGYLQTVVLPDVFSRNDMALHNRLRLVAEPEIEPFSLTFAYELAATIAQPGDAPVAIARGAGGGEDGKDWLHLHGVLADGETFNARHRIDRLRLSWSPTDTVELDLGRQAISWGTTLFLTPGDPFLPLHPTDPFREFRRGTDAVRLRVYPSPLTEVDLVIRPSRLDGEEELTALVRGLTTWHNWEVSAWGGLLYDRFAGAVGAAGDSGEWAVRLEAVLREFDGNMAGRGTIGFDRSLQVFDRDLRIGFEYQRDGHGAVGPADFERILESPAYRRGEFQVFGRDEFVVQGTCQIDPLWNVSVLVLWNMNNGSAILAPGLSYSLSDEATVAAGMYLGLSDSIPKESRPAESEDDLPDAIGFVSLSWYF